MKVLQAFLAANLAVALLFLSACDGDSPGGGGGGNNPSNPKRLNWETVAAEYNPQIDDFGFTTDGVEKININVFGFKDDVEIVYSENMEAHTCLLRVYRVWKDVATWGSLQPKQVGTTLDMNYYGNYECSISVKNGQIEALKGGCYVRLQLFLPPGAEIEVYNVGQLLTRRFIPITTEEFLENFDAAVWSKDQFAAIENFLNSYVGLNKLPSLTAEQLGSVIDDFSWKEEKFKALRRLHAVVSDRDNLGAMIENEFNHFEQAEARRIVGL